MLGRTLLSIEVSSEYDFYALAIATG